MIWFFETYVTDPILIAPVWWQTPLSSANCDPVDNMLKEARAWAKRNSTIPYKWQGPNSNSAANYVGGLAGFPVTAPPGSTGWNVPLPTRR